MYFPQKIEPPIFFSDDHMSLVQYMKYIGCFLAGKLAFPSYDVLWKIAVAVVTVSLLTKLVLGGKYTFLCCTNVNQGLP